LEIAVSFPGIHKWEPDIYIGFSPALHLQCVMKENGFYQIQLRIFYTQNDLTVVDLARNLGLSLETHLVHTEDGYILQVYSTEASLRNSIISNGSSQKPWVES
jgi:hypothetical protein